MTSLPWLHSYKADTPKYLQIALLNTPRFQLSPGDQRIHFRLEELCVTQTLTALTHTAQGSRVAPQLWQISCADTQGPWQQRGTVTTVTEPRCASPRAGPTLSVWVINELNFKECLSGSCLVLVPNFRQVFVWLRGPRGSVKSFPTAAAIPVPFLLSLAQLCPAVPGPESSREAAVAEWILDLEIPSFCQTKLCVPFWAAQELPLVRSVSDGQLWAPSAPELPHSVLDWSCQGLWQSLILSSLFL